MLLSLSITLLIVVNMTSILHLVKIKKADHDFDISIGVKQVSEYLLAGDIKEVSDQLIYEDEDKEKNIIEYDNHRLVKRPGYETLITNIDCANFYVKNNYIYLGLERNHHSYTYLIGNLYHGEKSNEETTQQ